MTPPARMAATHMPGGVTCLQSIRVNLPPHKERREDKRLNNLVAVTVVILSVFMAISKTKDDNINQAMQKAKADSVDAWAEYQFARVKLHVDENGLNQLRLLETAGTDRQGARRQAGRRIRGRHQEIRGPLQGNARQGRAARGRVRAAQFPRRPVRHVGRVPVDRGRARRRSPRWSISFALLYFAWGSGAIGLCFGIAGFAKLGFRPEWLASLLGT